MLSPVVVNRVWQPHGRVMYDAVTRVHVPWRPLGLCKRTEEDYRTAKTEKRSVTSVVRCQDKWLTFAEKGVCFRYCAALSNGQPWPRGEKRSLRDGELYILVHYSLLREESFFFVWSWIDEAVQGFCTTETTVIVGLGLTTGVILKVSCLHNILQEHILSS